jgi:hypothetical protein
VYQKTTQNGQSVEGKLVTVVVGESKRWRHNNKSNPSPLKVEE